MDPPSQDHFFPVWSSLGAPPLGAPLQYIDCALLMNSFMFTLPPPWRQKRVLLEFEDQNQNHQLAPKQQILPTGCVPTSSLQFLWFLGPSASPNEYISVTFLAIMSIQTINELTGSIASSILLFSCQLRAREVTAIFNEKH